jgi:dimethylaniline monooxygenase (N-oxide forming)
MARAEPSGSGSTSCRVEPRTRRALAPAECQFPSWSEVRAYLQQYVDYAALQPYLRCNTAVETLEPADDGRWSVRSHTRENTYSEVFDGAVVCAGRNQAPFLPQLPGADRFGGLIQHSSGYRGPEMFAGRDVVVVGVGSSGVDVATEVSQVARRVYLSMSPRTWFIPRYILKRPYDFLLTRQAAQLPVGVRNQVFRSLVVSAYRGYGVSLTRLQSRGILLPHFDLYRSRFTPCNPDLLQQITAGAIEGKPPVSKLEPHAVIFADGSRVAADVLLCCTGYQLQLPFLSPTLVEVTQGRVDLYHHIFPPQVPNLAFVGLVTVAGAHPPVAEMQARWVARVLSGAAALPGSAEMTATIERQRAHPLSQNPVPMWVLIPQYTDTIARILGVYPHPWRHPRHAYKLLMEPMSADDYRLDQRA